VTGGNHGEPSGKPKSLTGQTGSGDEELARRLDALGDRLEAVTDRKQAERKLERGSGDTSSLGQAFRLSTEFMAGVIVGGGFGWLIDRSFGSKPWGLMIFLLLGFGAGVWNVVRAAGRMNKRQG
jgi:ATP synthase protein I